MKIRFDDNPAYAAPGMSGRFGQWCSVYLARIGRSSNECFDVDDPRMKADAQDMPPLLAELSINPRRIS